MDVNGNGDGWNNVSPFGDNGNGAYPANPNLEQSYGYGGAWGYLYFNGVLGGTNTVRSVDLYYIHGRWWHPDMGLFLSPNEDGDYLFGGDGPPGRAPADWVWMAWSGGVCRFVNNEFLGTIAFSDKLSEILTQGRASTWYGETCLGYEDEPAYQVGSHFGDAASIGLSIWEVGVGGGGAGLGVFGAPETGGGSLAVTAGGGALALHGVGVGGTVLVKNLSGAAQEIFSFAQGTQRAKKN